MSKRQVAGDVGAGNSLDQFCSSGVAVGSSICIHCKIIDDAIQRKQTNVVDQRSRTITWTSRGLSQLKPRKITKPGDQETIRLPCVVAFDGGDPLVCLDRRFRCFPAYANFVRIFDLRSVGKQIKSHIVKLAFDGGEVRVNVINKFVGRVQVQYI